MATYVPSCFLIQFLEQLLKFLVNFTLLKYVKSQRSYGLLITKELIFDFQISEFFSLLSLLNVKIRAVSESYAWKMNIINIITLFFVTLFQLA